MTRPLDGAGQMSPVRGGRRNQSVVDDLFVMPMDVSVSKAKNRGVGISPTFCAIASMAVCWCGCAPVGDRFQPARRGIAAGHFRPAPRQDAMAADLPAPVAKLIQKALFTSRKPAADANSPRAGGVHGRMVIRAGATPIAVKGGKTLGGGRHAERHFDGGQVGGVGTSGGWLNRLQ